MQTIVFDNGSSDGTVDLIENDFRQVQLIRSKKNLGFGQANNAGIKAALNQGAESVFLLNQDAWVEKDTLSKLMQVQQDNPGYGIISPVHLNGSGSAPDLNFLQYFRKSQLSDWLSAVLLKENPGDCLVQTDFVNAAGWLLSAECLRNTGEFDPFFFHYGEDINYCQRVIYHGYKIGIHTGSHICHDRENRLAVADDSQSVLKREWINLANYVCDIRHTQFAMIFWKRLLRQVFNLFTGGIMLHRESVQFNAYMIGKMLRSMTAMRKSRAFAFRSRFR